MLHGGAAVSALVLQLGISIFGAFSEPMSLQEGEM